MSIIVKIIEDAVKAHSAYRTEDTIDTSGLRKYLLRSNFIQSLDGIAAVTETLMAGPNICILVEDQSAMIIKAEKRSWNQGCWKVEGFYPQQILTWALPPISAFERLGGDSYGWSILGCLSEGGEKPEHPETLRKYVAFQNDIKVVLNLRDAYGQLETHPNTKSTHSAALGIAAMAAMIEERQ